jgi:cell division protein FtsB
MVKFRGNNKKIIYSGWTALVLIIILIILIRSTWSVFQKERGTEGNLSGTNEEMVLLEDRRDLLIKEIERLNSEKGIEEEIREKFRVVKQGEEMLMIIEGPGNLPNGTEEESFWQKFIDRF